ncbi:MAG: FHIPEP family type III secretion protein [Pseudomonadota bacterium]
MADEPVKVSIVVTTDNGTQSAVDAVQTYARLLCESLDLPIEPVVSFDASEPRDKVLIDGTAAALAPAHVRTETQSDRIAAALFDNRECLVTTDVARQVFKIMELDATATGFSDFHNMLRGCVRAARGLDRLTAVRSPELAVAPSRWLEAALTAAGSAGAKIELPTSAYNALIDSKTGKHITITNDQKSFDNLLEMLSEGLFWETGGLFRVDLGSDPDLAENEFRIGVNDIVGPPRIGLNEDTILINDTSDRLTLLGAEAEHAVNPTNLSDAAVVLKSDVAMQIIENMNLSSWGWAEYIVLHVGAILRTNAGAFYTEDVAEYNLERLRVHFPDLVGITKQRFFPETLTGAFRALLDEGISIRNLRAHLEAALEIQGTTSVDQRKNIVFGPEVGSVVPDYGPGMAPSQNATLIADHMRSSARDYISHKYTRGQNTLVVYLLDAEIEELLSANVDDPLPIETQQSICAAVRATLDNVGTSLTQPVILTTVDVRRRLYQIARHEFPRLAVLSYNELMPNMNIQPVERIALEEGVFA